MRRTILTTLAVLVAAGVLFVRARPTPQRPGASDVPGSSVPGPGRADGDEVDEALVAETLPDAGNDAPSRPRSLRGTRTDGGLVTDADGHFVPTLDARRLFDYFLTATGEIPDDTIRARIQQEIERRLQPPAAAEALALLDRYLVYRERVRTLAQAEVPDDGDLDARLATLMALRREVLGPDAAEAFFADEEADARRLLEARRIDGDPNLTAEERATRIEAIFRESEAELPADVREARAAARLATTLRGAEAEIRARGGDDAEIAAARARIAGPAAAARLGDLDRQRSAWQARVDAFRTARDRLERDTSLTAESRATAVGRLLDESFTAAERRRVEALDRIAAEAPSAP